MMCQNRKDERIAFTDRPYKFVTPQGHVHRMLPPYWETVYIQGPSLGICFDVAKKSVAEIEKVILDRSVWRHEEVKANQLTVSHSTKGIKRDRPTYCIKTPLAKQFHLTTLRHHFKSAEPPTSSNVFPLWQSSSYRTIMMKQFNIPSTISGSIVDFHVHHSFRLPNAFRSFCRLAPKTYDHIWSHVVSDDLPHNIPATCQVDKMCPKEARLSEEFWRSSSWRVCWSKAVSNLRTTQGYLVIVDIFVC